MLHSETRSVETLAHKWAEADNAAKVCAVRDLQMAESNCGTLSHALKRDGRINEAAFWAKMGVKVTTALVDIQAGADPRVELRVYRDLLKARLFDLKCAVDNDDNLRGAKPDGGDNRNLRRCMTEGL